MNVVLIGMKHCGKSAIGSGLAQRWGCAFHDVDPMIAAMHACEHGEQLTVRQVFDRYGEEYFHRIEGHVVCELYLKLDRPGSQAVVALGGRTALNSTVCGLLRAIGLIVYLWVPPAVVFKRIERSGLPSFLAGDDPEARFMELYREREPQYRAIAQVTVELDGKGSVDGSVDRLISSIEEHQHGRQ